MLKALMIKYIFLLLQNNINITLKFRCFMLEALMIKYFFYYYKITLTLH